MAKRNPFSYTNGERSAIAEAHEAAAEIADAAGGALAGELAAALRLETRNRQSEYVAKAIIVEGFLEGFGRDPRASSLARHTPGARTAIIVGGAVKAHARSSGRADGAGYDRVVRLCREAAAAHARMLDRGLARTAQAVTSQEASDNHADISPL